ncbi:MAG: hypothetical protein SGARI_004096, partial [Bacillariaceae sp.]
MAGGGLKFFQGNRGGGGSKKKTAAAAASNVYHPAPSAPPSPSPHTVNIPHAVPVAAYVPPSTKTVVSTPPQHQRQFITASGNNNTSSAPPSSSLGMYNNSGNTSSTHQQQSNGNGLMISNQEIDRELKLWQRATLGGRTLPHKLFIIFSLITILTAVNNIIAHVLAIAFYGSKEDPMEQLLRMFTIGWFVLVILIESDRSEL